MMSVIQCMYNFTHYKIRLGLLVGGATVTFSKEG